MPRKGAQARSSILAIACIRCRHKKKKCDHVVPRCGECSRSGTDCVRFEERKPRDAASVPWEYVRSLEARLAHVEKALAGDLSRSERPFSSSKSGSCPKNSAKATREAPSSANEPASVIKPLSQESISSVVTADLDKSAFDTPAMVSSTPRGRILGVEQGEMCLWNISAMVDNTVMPQPANTLESTVLGQISPSAPSISTHYVVSSGITSSDLLRADYDCYFQFVHPNWSFLEEDVLEEWYHTCVDQKMPPAYHQLFFVHLVCAIGAFYSSPSDRGCPHIARSRALWDQAVRLFLPGAVQQSPKIRLQAYLLIVICALHSPTPFQLHDSTNEAILELTDALSNYKSTVPLAIESWDRIAGHLGSEVMDSDEQNYRSVMIYCYSAYELIASAWNRPFQELVGLLDEKIWHQGFWLTFDGILMDPGFEHLFAARRIQSRIRRFWDTLGFINSQQDKYRLRAEIKSELDQWKAMIPMVSNNVGRSANYHPLSMLKLYDYCICNLYQHEAVFPSLEDFSTLLAAASENCRCFRRIQEHRPMAYCTWGGLFEQFRVGILMLACFWETPYVYRNTTYQAAETLQALEDCESTLSQFAKRWEAAEVYFETYKLLLSQTPVLFPDNSPFHFPQYLVTKMRRHVEALENGGVSMSVLSLVNRIVYRTARDLQQPSDTL